VNGRKCSVFSHVPEKATVGGSEPSSIYTALLTVRRHVMKSVVVMVTTHHVSRRFVRRSADEHVVTILQGKQAQPMTEK